MKIFSVVFIACMFFSSVMAEDVLSFSNAKHKEDYEALLVELRCLVCQNQNLADSDAGLANDLKSEVYDMLAEGKSKQDIKSFMTERYGNFVLYKPPFNISTVILWLGPFLLLLFGFIFLYFHIKKRQSSSAKNETLSEEEKNNLNAILNQHKGNKK